MKVLIENGAKMNLVDDCGNPALHYDGVRAPTSTVDGDIACRIKYLSALQLLIDKSGIDVPGRKRNLAFFSAANAGQVEITFVLLREWFILPI